MTARDMAWMTRAACATRPGLPWTTDAADVTAWQAATMRAICADCPVLPVCSAAADALGVTGGWWAGHDRDPRAATTRQDPPAWAGQPTAPGTPAGRGEPVPHPAGPATAAGPAAQAREPAPVGWVLVRGRHGRVVGEQAAWHLGGAA